MISVLQLPQSTPGEKLVPIKQWLARENKRGGFCLTPSFALAFLWVGFPRPVFLWRWSLEHRSVSLFPRGVSSTDHCCHSGTLLDAIKAVIRTLSRLGRNIRLWGFLRSFFTSKCRQGMSSCFTEQAESSRRAPGCQQEVMKRARIPQLPPVCSLLPKLKADVVLQPVAACPAATALPPITQRCSHGSSVSWLALPIEARWGDVSAVALAPFGAHFVH